MATTYDGVTAEYVYVLIGDHIKATVQTFWHWINKKYDNDIFILLPEFILDKGEMLMDLIQ